MPIPDGFDNTVRLVTGAPVGAADVNAELTAQNAAGFWVTDIKFLGANNALLMFVKMDATYVDPGPQKVNLVGVSQAALDADKATEIVAGYWPTGFFVTPGGSALIMYQLLDPPPV